MKGMQKVSRGRGFRGTLNYVFERKDGKDQGVLIGGNIAGTTINQLSSEFGRFRKLREDIEKPVWHQSLRLPKGETLSNEKWNEVGHDYMKRMGFDQDKNQYAFVLHDTDHIHIIANRIDIDGNLWLGRNENIESTRHIAQIEKDHGLTITKNMNYEQDDQGNWLITPGQDIGNRKANTTSSERHMDNARAQDAFMRGEAYEGSAKLKLTNRISKALEGGATISQFIERMEDDNQVKVYATIKKNEMVGFSFTFEDVAYKGSQVAASWKELTTTKGLYYDKDTDIRLLQEATRRATTIKSADRKSKLRPAKHATAGNENRDSAGRFSTNDWGIGEIERDMPEPQARIKANKSGLSNSSNRTQQVSSLIRESTEPTANVSFRSIRPFVPPLDKDSSIPSSDSSDSIGRGVGVRTPCNSSPDTVRGPTTTSPGTTSTTASSSTSTSSPGTDAIKTPKEELAPKVKARIQQIAKTGNYTFNEAARIWVQEEQRRIKEKFAVAPSWTPDNGLSDRIDAHAALTKQPTEDKNVNLDNYEESLRDFIKSEKDKINRRSSHNEKDDYGNSR